MVPSRASAVVNCCRNALRSMSRPSSVLTDRVAEMVLFAVATASLEFAAAAAIVSFAAAIALSAV